MDTPVSHTHTQNTRKCLFKSPVDAMQECATWICYTTCKYLDQRKLKEELIVVFYHEV